MTQKPKNASVGVDAQIYARLNEVCEKTGLSVKALAGHLIKDGLDRIEKGGGIQISVTDGSIVIPNRIAPPAQTQAPAPRTEPKPPQTEFPVREINMSAFKA